MKNRILAFITAAVLTFSQTAYADEAASSLADFKQTVQEPYQNGETDKVEAILGMDMSDKITGTNSVRVTVDENDIHEMHKEVLGVQSEAGISYSYFYDENDELKPEYAEFAEKTTPVPTFRWGGTSSAFMNLWDSVKPFEQRVGGQTFYHAGNELKSSAANKMGIVEWVKMAYANNHDAQIIPAVSYLLMTPEEIGKLAHFFYDAAEESEYGKMRAELGIKDPIKVYYWEMTNEIDMLGEENREYIQEYIDTVKAYAEEIRNVEPDAKIAACGPTAPWGHYWNVAEDSDQWWAWWHRQIMPQLADTVDAITFHPYYDGYSTEFMFYFMDTMKADCDKIVEEQGIKDKDGNPKDIKILSTEAARFWDPSDWFWGSSCHEAALSSSHFLNTAMKRDWFVGSSYHHLTGYNLWAYWGINDGEWYESPTAKLYRLYNDNLGDRIVGSSYEMLNDDYKELGEYDTVPFSLVVSANGNNELTVILLNKEPYKDVNVEFEFKNDYTLVEESVFSSPNISTFAYDKTAEEMTKITTTQTDEKNFKSYHMKSATVVALKLKTNSKIPQKSGESTVESEPEADTGKSFSDIQNHWARNEIALMQENGMVSGVNNSEFAPERTVTKAEFAAIASRVMGFDTEKYAGSAFADCSGTEWYTGFANAMKANGYIRGTVFDAAAGITVADLCRTAVLMYENGGVPEVDEIDVSGIENLTDIQKEYVKKAAKYGLINRLFENGKCDFSANATRAEVTYVLYRVYSHNR